MHFKAPHALHSSRLLVARPMKKTSTGLIRITCGAMIGVTSNSMFWTEHKQKTISYTTTTKKKNMAGVYWVLHIYNWYRRFQLMSHTITAMLCVHAVSYVIASLALTLQLAFYIKKKILLLDLHPLTWLLYYCRNVFVLCCKNKIVKKKQAEPLFIK